MKVIIADAVTQSVMENKRSNEADQNLRKPYVNESIFSKSCSSAPVTFQIKRIL